LPAAAAEMFYDLLYLVSGPIEADPEYQLIVEANNVTVEIDNEISEFCLIHCMEFTAFFMLGH